MALCSFFNKCRGCCRPKLLTEHGGIQTRCPASGRSVLLTCFLCMLLCCRATVAERLRSPCPANIPGGAGCKHRGDKIKYKLKKGCNFVYCRVPERKSEVEQTLNVLLFNPPSLFTPLPHRSGLTFPRLGSFFSMFESR